MEWESGTCLPGASHFLTAQAGWQLRPVHHGHYGTGDNPARPIPENPDAKTSLVTDTGLFVSNKTDLQMMGMHQLEMKKDGMRLELGVFFPENSLARWSRTTSST